jgi:hypothetical protein
MTRVLQKIEDAAATFNITAENRVTDTSPGGLDSDLFGGPG